MAGRQAQVNHTSTCTVTISSDCLEAQVWAVRDAGQQVTMQVSSRAGAQAQLPGSCSVQPTPALTPSCPLGPQPPASLTPFPEAGLIASERAWPGSTARGHLSAGLRGAGRGLPDLYRSGRTALLHHGAPGTGSTSRPDSHQQVLGPNVTSSEKPC